MFKKIFKPKYKWLPFKEGMGGFLFNDPLMRDGDEILGTVWVHRKLCLLLKTTTKRSIWWKDGYPDDPVYYAIGQEGIFYDDNTVLPFSKFVHSQPVIWEDWQLKMLEETRYLVELNNPPTN